MTLSLTLAEHIRACFTGLWIETCEPDEALREINAHCREQEWPVLTWDAAHGLQGIERSEVGPQSSDIVDALRTLQSTADGQTPTLLVLSNLHHLLGSIELIEELRHAIEAGKHRRTFVVVLAPVVQIPAELEKLMIVLEHDLPGREQLETIARETATEPDELPDDDEIVRLLDASAGLTRYEALISRRGLDGAMRCHWSGTTQAWSISFLKTDVLWELKEHLHHRPVDSLSFEDGRCPLQLYDGVTDDSFSDLGGMNALKRFCKRSLSHSTSRQRRRSAGRTSARRDAVKRCWAF